MMNDVFKVVLVGEIGLWALAWSMSIMGLAKDSDAGKVMGLSIGLAVATAVAWKVVSQ